MEVEKNCQEGNDESADRFVERVLKQIGVERIDETLIDGSGPLAVDREKVRAYVLKQLSGEQERQIEELTLNYRDWFNERKDVLIELARESQGRDEDDQVAK